jgi:hypothetical protein
MQGKERLHALRKRGYETSNLRTHSELEGAPSLSPLYCYRDYAASMEDVYISSFFPVISISPRQRCGDDRSHRARVKS